jgi:Tol biopolymer transport system component
VENTSELSPQRWNVSYVPSNGAGGATLVTSATDGIDQTSPCWSPDGKRIAYTHWIDGDHSIIYSRRLFQ